jgi:SAM-dependent methyltransferase
MLDVLNIQTSYDRVAQEYARHYFDELEHKPFDRELLDRLVQGVNGSGPICDLGCGPGQIARYLHRHGAKASGIDLSEEMVKQARRFNPEIEFQPGNMLALDDIPDDQFGGIAAFYSIIHIARPEVPRALQEIMRVLRPAGVLLLAFHVGQEIIHREEWWGEKVSVDFIFYEAVEMKEFLRGVGFEKIEAFEREPYEEVEYPSRRAYIFARKPGSDALS